jgi:hypothetical protein
MFCSIHNIVIFAVLSGLHWEIDSAWLLSLWRRGYAWGCSLCCGGNYLITGNTSGNLKVVREFWAYLERGNITLCRNKILVLKRKSTFPPFWTPYVSSLSFTYSCSRSSPLRQSRSAPCSYATPPALIYTLDLTCTLIIDWLIFTLCMYVRISKICYIWGVPISRTLSLSVSGCPWTPRALSQLRHFFFGIQPRSPGFHRSSIHPRLVVSDNGTQSVRVIQFLITVFIPNNALDLSITTLSSLCGVMKRLQYFKYSVKWTQI